MTRKDLLKALWPTDGHPITGEKFVRCLRLERNTEIHEVHTQPPAIPCRAVYEFVDDSDTPKFIRLMTDAEFLEAMESYNRELEEWMSTGGVIRTTGQSTIVAEFVTESGFWAKGLRDGETWIWTDTFDDQRKPKRRFNVSIQWKAKEGNEASEKQVVINTDAQQTYRKFRVVHITNNLADYPEDAADTAEFPDLVERIEDEEEVFVVEEGVDFWPAGEFFFMQDIREFLVPCKKD